MNEKRELVEQESPVPYLKTEKIAKSKTEVNWTR